MTQDYPVIYKGHQVSMSRSLVNSLILCSFSFYFLLQITHTKISSSGRECAWVLESAAFTSN